MALAHLPRVAAWLDRFVLPERAGGESGQPGGRLAALACSVVALVFAMGAWSALRADLMELALAALAGALLLVLAIALVYDRRSRRAFGELRLALQRAESADRAKSEFVACLSHELRTPLNVLIGWTDMLLDTPLSEDQARLVRDLRSSSGGLLRLVNGLLDLSRIEAGKLDLEVLPFDVKAAVQHVVQQLAPAARAKGIGLEARIDASLPSVVVGDAGRLQQILMNLLGNAIKFTSEGRATVDAFVAGDLRERVLVSFAVQDTGIGIPEEEIPRLFEKFTQIESSTARRFGGTGLGLAISRELVHLMHGELEVRSRPGEGSHFAFTLPLAVARPASAETRRPPATAQPRVRETVRPALAS